MTNKDNAFYVKKVVFLEGSKYEVSVRIRPIGQQSKISEDELSIIIDALDD